MTSILETYRIPKTMGSAFYTAATSSDGFVFIIDDSGSMLGDRWSELLEALKFPEEYLNSLNIPLDIFCINSPEIRRTLEELTTFIPSGCTPICAAIKTLLKKDSKKRYILFTDGEPSDGDLYETLKPMIGDHIEFVVRLCTQDAATVKAYNRIKDSRITILDDPESEAKEVYRYNPWLNFTMSIYNLRMLGGFKELSNIDVRPLDDWEIYDVLDLLLWRTKKQWSPNCPLGQQVRGAVNDMPKEPSLYVGTNEPFPIFYLSILDSQTWKIGAWACRLYDDNEKIIMCFIAGVIGLALFLMSRM